MSTTAANTTIRRPVHPPRRGSGKSDGARFDLVDVAVEQLDSASDPRHGVVAATKSLAASLDGCAAAVLLSDTDGLRVAAACTGSLSALRCVDIACDHGPCPYVSRTGVPVLAHQLQDRAGTFGASAAAAGFSSAYALPIARPDRSPDGALLVLAPRPYALNRSTTIRLRALTDAIAERLDIGVRAEASKRTPHERD